MRPLVAVLACALVGVLTALPSAQRGAVGDAGDFVELDAVVVDGKGQPVHGLTAEDFSIREDGKPVSITTFDEVTAPLEPSADAARTLVLLLDDTGVASIGTQTVQIIAKAFVLEAGGLDEVSVVRLHTRDDEPFGDRMTAATRILGYRGGAYPAWSWSIVGDVLQRLSDTARLVASNSSRRKVIVCIGSPYVCNMREPDPSAPRSFESLWATTMAETAKANVSVYAVIPGRAPLRSGGIADMTGGEVFTPSSDIMPVIERILRDGSNYYLLGYWPVKASRGLHKVEVKTTRRGARVHARRLR